MFKFQKDQNNKMTESAPIFHSLRRFLPFIIYLLSSILIYPQSYQELQRLQSEYKKALERQALQKPADISEAEKIAQGETDHDKMLDVLTGKKQKGQQFDDVYKKRKK